MVDQAVAAMIVIDCEAPVITEAQQFKPIYLRTECDLFDSSSTHQLITEAQRIQRLRREDVVDWLEE